MPDITSVAIAGGSAINIGTPAMASPVMKQTMVISGSNFGADKSLLEVWLVKENVPTYQLNINDLTGGDTLTVTLGGGRVGEYKLRIKDSVKGFSVADFDFYYRIGIDSLSANTGNKNGGVELTITGFNFMADVKGQ